jgi:hypothetical protein
MRWAALALLLVGCGAAEAGAPEAPRDPIAAVWADVFVREDAPPYIEWVEGDCGGPELGMSVRNDAARTTYCLGGQAMSEEYVRVARWPGATLQDRELARRVAHEFAHSHIMRLGTYDGDYYHQGPEWLPGDLVDRARDYLATPR